MRKFYLVLTATLGLLPSVASAQTLLDEGFEISSTESYTDVLPDGWTTKDAYAGNTLKYRWCTAYSEKGIITGTHAAQVDAPMFAGDDGAGPRQEVLLTPELDLNDTYQLSFDWKAASASALENDEYDFKVKVVVDGDIENAATLWSFHDADQLQESGVVTYPWTGWQVYNSKLDLSEYQGKKVKVAFVYDLLKEKGNVVYLDNVTVKKFSPATGPKASLSRRQYSFGNVYVGSKVYSDAITLTNTGKSGLKITDIELPNGVTTTLDKDAVDLKANETVDFQLIYLASLQSTADGKVVIKTNGGDVEIRVTATKTSIPADATFETFEQGVPPAGWTTNGWRASSYALEGDYSAYASASLDGAQYLVSPRLDLATGSHKIDFTYFNQFEGETDSSVPENDITVEFSTDGGATWKTCWTAPTDAVNTIESVSVDLGSPASDNCYVRWAYSAVEYDSESYPELSIFFLDCVMLPKIYGLGGVPQLSSAVSPENGATDVYNKTVKLEWTPALLATGYKIYVGTDAAAGNVVNGQDVGNVTSYTLAKLDYATTYNWKVVPYNEKGDAADAPVWSFTTLTDQTVSTFPYQEGFNGDTFPLLGWYNETTTSAKWSNNSISPYEGKYSASVSGYGDESEVSLVSPDFVLPDESMEIGFFWGNAMPVALTIDESGMAENTTTADDGIDVCFFEVLADGEWHQKAILSDKNNKYWCHEQVDLSEYAGKTVAFRWRYLCHDYFKSTGVGLDLITIDSKSDVKASFNVSEWDAGKVNYGSHVSAKNKLSILNNGSSALKITKTSFTTGNFAVHNLKDVTIEPKKGVAFGLTFYSGDASKLVEDVLTVEFEGGYTISLPVKGEGLAIDARYYDFENDEPGSLSPTDFTTIDVDKSGTIAMTGMSYPQRGAAFAFSVQCDADWNNVLHPVSGENALVAICPDDDNIAANDWIVSKQLVATEKSKFSFYARNWESNRSVLPSNKASIEVLVSTTSNTSTDAFESVMQKVEMPFYDDDSYGFYEVDLSKYAGQKIYVALNHTVQQGLASFFDDFLFEGFDGISGSVASVGVDGVKVYPNPAADVVFVDGVVDADLTVTSVSGAIVKSVKNAQSVNVADLSRGVYLLTVKTGNDTFTTRIIKK